jgi:hypothetical protein
MTSPQLVAATIPFCHDGGMLSDPSLALIPNTFKKDGYALTTSVNNTIEKKYSKSTGRTYRIRQLQYHTLP